MFGVCCDTRCDTTIYVNFVSFLRLRDVTNRKRSSAALEDDVEMIMPDINHSNPLKKQKVNSTQRHKRTASLRSNTLRHDNHGDVTIALTEPSSTSSGKFKNSKINRNNPKYLLTVASAVSFAVLFISDPNKYGVRYCLHHDIIPKGDLTADSLFNQLRNTPRHILRFLRLPVIAGVTFNDVPDVWELGAMCLKEYVRMLVSQSSDECLQKMDWKKLKRAKDNDPIWGDKGLWKWRKISITQIRESLPGVDGYLFKHGLDTG